MYQFRKYGQYDVFALYLTKHLADYFVKLHTSGFVFCIISRASHLLIIDLPIKAARNDVEKCKLINFSAHPIIHSIY